MVQSRHGAFQDLRSCASPRLRFDALCRAAPIQARNLMRTMMTDDIRYGIFKVGSRFVGYADFSKFSTLTDAQDYYRATGHQVTMVDSTELFMDWEVGSGE